MTMQNDLAAVLALAAEAESNCYAGGKHVAAAAKAYLFIRTHAAELAGLVKDRNHYLDLLRRVDALCQIDALGFISLNESGYMALADELGAAIDGAEPNPIIAATAGEGDVTNYLERPE